MSRNRKAGNRDLPLNTYSKRMGENTYYYWEHPAEHWQQPFAQDREKAIDVGGRLNRMLEAQGIRPDVRESIPPSATIGRLVDRFLPEAIDTQNSPSSKKNVKNHLLRIKSGLGREDIRRVKPLDLMDWLDETKSTTQYNRLLYWLQELFAFGIRTGALPLNSNNAAAAIKRRSQSKPKRQRLTMKQYNLIYDKAPLCLQIAMDIMLHTALRPGDVVNLKFEQYSEGKLYTCIKKTGGALAIEFSPAEEKQIIRRARLSGIASPYIVHFTPKRKGKNYSKLKTHPTQLTVDYISGVFTDIRDMLGIHANLPAKERPPLVDVRSLSSWLYEQSGRDPKAIQDLMHHAGQEMTEHYMYSRREDFIQVKAGLDLSSVIEEIQ